MLITLFNMCGWQQGPSLKEFFLDTSEHRMRLHIGKRHSDKRTVHHCKPKDGGGGDKRKFKGQASWDNDKKGARKQLKRRHNTNYNTWIIQDTGFQLDIWLFKNLQVNKVWNTDLLWSKDKYWIWLVMNLQMRRYEGKKGQGHKEAKLISNATEVNDSRQGNSFSP